MLAHPECEERVLGQAHFIGSTSALIKRAMESTATRFIIATEPGVIHEMKKRAPGKEFIPAPAEGGCACNECPHMRLEHAGKSLSGAARPNAAADNTRESTAPSCAASDGEDAVAVVAALGAAVGAPSADAPY